MALERVVVGFIKIHKSDSHEGGTYLCKEMNFDCENNCHTIMLCLYIMNINLYIE